MAPNILLVEDTPLRRDWFNDHYGQEQIDWTDDPDVAIGMLQRGSYDTLFLDHDLGRPGSGRDVTLWLIANPAVLPTLRILTHTHNPVSGPKIERECLVAGRPCAWKPFGSWEPEDLDNEAKLMPSGQWVPATASQMLRAWGVAELRSPRGEQALQAGLVSVHLLSMLRAQEFDAISPDGWASVEDAIIAMRGQLVSSLLHLELHWYDRTLDHDAISALRFFNLPEWQAKWSSQMLVDLAGEPDLARTGPEFHGFETVIERPIVVGPSLNGPFCLVEGYTRVCTWLRDMQKWPVPHSLPFLIGISPRIEAWAHPRGHRWWPAKEGD